MIPLVGLFVKFSSMISSFSYWFSTHLKKKIFDQYLGYLYCSFHYTKMYRPNWNTSTLIKNPQIGLSKCAKRPRPLWDILTLLRNPQIDPSNQETSKAWKKKSTKSKKVIKIIEQPLQYWEMGLPIYQIKMYQKAPSITKHTNITQKFSNWS